MTILLSVDIFGTPIVMSGSTGHRKKKFLHVSSWTINVGIAHILIRDMTPPQKKNPNVYDLQRGHNVRKYGNVRKCKKMYGIVGKESWCTVRTKICTDVRNYRKKLNPFHLLLGMYFRDPDYCLQYSFMTTLIIITFSIFGRINY